MASQIEFARQILKAFLARKEAGASPSIDRNEIVAHATLSGLAAHWPSRSSDDLNGLLEATKEIKSCEHTRWMVQRRIAIAKLSKALA